MGRQSQLPLRKYFYPNKRSSENLKAKLHSLKMEHILDETVPAEDLKRFEQKYHEELQHGKVSSSSQFEYAWCLVRSRYPADIRKGIGGDSFQTIGKGWDGWNGSCWRSCCCFWWAGWAGPRTGRQTDDEKIVAGFVRQCCDCDLSLSPAE